MRSVSRYVSNREDIVTPLLITGDCTPAYEAVMYPNLSSQGHLVPSDEITVYYSSQPAGEYLDQVIQAHTDFILATTKAPLKPYPVAQNASVIVQEKTQVLNSRDVLILLLMP